MNTVRATLISTTGNQIPILEAPCTIGRSSGCTVNLPFPDVSKRHAIMIHSGDDWWLADCGSRNGTWLNGRRLDSASRLADGDNLLIGSTRLRFACDAHPSFRAFTEEMLETMQADGAEYFTTDGMAVMWVDAEHRIVAAADEAMLWLETFFDPPEGGHLPVCLASWLRSQTSGCFPFEKRIGDERLRIQARSDKDGKQLLILSRLLPTFGETSLSKIGFSKAEVLLIPWLVRGKRNDEIGLILELSPRTIEKQVASIMQKLGVETRAAAAWSIIERCGGHF